MKLIDVLGLTPKALKASLDWLAVIAARFPEATLLTTNAERYAWLKKLSGADVWGDVQVVTSIDHFLFWRLVNERVEVIDSGGKKMGKGYYTTAQREWAAALVTGDHRKATVNRLLKLVDKQQPVPQKYDELLVDFTAAGKDHGLDDVGLIETDGVYETVTLENFDQVRVEVLNHVERGGLVAWDSETDQNAEEDSDAPNPYTARLVGLSIAIRGGHAWYFPIAHDEGTCLSVDRVLDLVRALYPAARQGGGRVLLHNAKYDYSVLANPHQRVPVAEVFSWLGVTEDTMLFASVLNLPAKLKVLAPQLLGVKHIDFKRLTRGMPFSKVPLEPATIYGGQDADWLLRLWPLLKARSEEWDLNDGVHTWDVYHNEELPVIEYWMRMERRGMFIDQDVFNRHWLREGWLRDYTYKRFHEAALRAFIVLPKDFNINAPEQMRWLMFDKLRLPVVERTKSGLASTGSKALMELKSRGVYNPILGWADAWKEHQKKHSSFLNPISKFLQGDSRIRPSILSTGADTGRTSMHDPNGQQFYAELRECVTADGGTDAGGEIAAADYGQVELRVLAAVHHEPKMLNVYRLQRYLFDADGEHVLDKKGQWAENPDADIHGLTQREVGLPTRTKAKNFNFGTAFGAQAPTLSKTAGIPLPQTEQFVKKFWAAYPDYRMSLDAMVLEAMGRGYTTTWRGRPRLLTRPDRPHDKLEQQRLIANTPVQGGALDIAKSCAVQLLPLLRQAEPVGIYPVNFVHDEFDFERSPGVPAVAWEYFMSEVKRIMIQTNPFIEQVPLDVDIEVGKSWGSHQLREMRGLEKLNKYMAEQEVFA